MHHFAIRAESGMIKIPTCHSNKMPEDVTDTLEGSVLISVDLVDEQSYCKTYAAPEGCRIVDLKSEKEKIG